MNTEQLKKIEETTKAIVKQLLIDESTDKGWTEQQRMQWLYNMIGEKLTDLLTTHLISSDEIKREAVGVLAKGNQSGNATKESGVFFQLPNSGGLISVEKQRLYNLFTEWLEAMGWLGEFTSGQETAIFEWFDNNYLTQSKEGGE